VEPQKLAVDRDRLDFSQVESKSSSLLGSPLNDLFPVKNLLVRPRQSLRQTTLIRCCWATPNHWFPLLKYKKPENDRDRRGRKLVGQGEMCMQRICGATFFVSFCELLPYIWENPRQNRAPLHQKQLLEHCNLGTYIHRARNTWES
jgi:hypothetical protein